MKTRREFGGSALAVLAAGLIPAIAHGQIPKFEARIPKPALTAAQRRRVGVATTSFATIFPIRNGPSGPPAYAPKPGSPSYLEAPAFIADHTGLSGVELWTMQFEDFGSAYLRDLTEAARRARTTFTNLEVDDPENELISSPNDTARERGLAWARAWIDRAAVMGIPSLRFNPGFPPRPPSPPGAPPGPPPGPFPPPTGPVPYDRIIDGYRQLALYGAGKKVTVVIENHTGYSRVIDDLVKILQGVNLPNFGAEMDWGGGGPRGGTIEDRLADRKKLAPWLKIISAKAGTFDENYVMTDFDVGTMVRASESWGFRGVYSIEVYGRTPPDPVRAVASVRDQILANLSA